MVTSASGWVLVTVWSTFCALDGHEPDGRALVTISGTLRATQATIAISARSPSPRCAQPRPGPSQAEEITTGVPSGMWASSQRPSGSVRRMQPWLTA
jgi:hypothetical protein